RFTVRKARLFATKEVSSHARVALSRIGAQCRKCLWIRCFLDCSAARRGTVRAAFCHASDRLELLETSHAKLISKVPLISRSANHFRRCGRAQERSCASFFSSRHSSHFTSSTSVGVLVGGIFSWEGLTWHVSTGWKICCFTTATSRISSRL